MQTCISDTVSRVSLSTSCAMRCAYIFCERVDVIISLIDTLDLPRASVYTQLGPCSSASSSRLAVPQQHIATTHHSYVIV
jgi:hypothetical protein